MKFVVTGNIACLFMVLASSLSSFGSAFVVAPPTRVYYYDTAGTTVSLSAKTTKAASSKEEDLELTRQVIAKFAGIESSPDAEPKKEEAAAAAGASKEE